MGLKQDLGNIVAAARLTARQESLRWVLMGDGSQREQLEREGAGLTNLQFLPLCAEGEYADMLAAADILLLNERAGVAGMSLPSKLTGYFMSGRPVAAAVEPGGATSGELTRAGAPAPVAPGDPSALVDLVASLAATPDKRDAYGLDALAYAEENLTFAAAMRKYDAVIEQAVARPPGGAPS